MKEKAFYDQLFDTLEQVITVHRKGDTHSTTDLEQHVLTMTDEAIKAGDAELYPMKALLTASNDWSTCIITRISIYRDILLDGIEAGALAPGNDYAWQWISLAAENNDPEEFADDMERWYDLLATAAEGGNHDALDIMNRIWEPENIIEED